MVERKRRGWRWVKRAVLAALAFIALAVIAALLTVHTGWGREMVRRQVEQRLAEMFVGGASVRLIEGSPFTELTLHDLVINGPDKRPAIAVKTLDVQVGILPLLSHQARVAGVTATDVDIDLRRGPGGELQIAHLMRPGPSSGWSVSLPSVELRRAHIRFDSGREVMNFDELTIDARATVPHGGPLDASIELYGTWRERGGAGLILRAAIHRDDEGVLVPYLYARAGDVTVIGTHVTMVPQEAQRAPVIGGVVTVDATAAAVQRLVPDLRLPVDAALTVTATPKRGEPWTEVLVAGRVDRTELQFKGAVDVDARHARGELVTTEVDLTKLTAGKVVGSAAGDGRRGELGGRARARHDRRRWTGREGQARGDDPRGR
jgi:hypothetical protein